MASSTPQVVLYDENDAEALFNKFEKDFERNYKDEEDRQAHFEAFKGNLKKINEMNSKPGQTATFGINKFADYTEEERKSMFGGRIPAHPK